MDFLLPPKGLFDWEDPSLDPNAISHSHQPPGKGLPMVLSGALVLMIGGVLWCLPEAAWGRSTGALVRSWTGKREVSVLLTPETVPKAPPPLPSPLPSPQRPTLGKAESDVDEGPSGGGEGGNGMRPPDTGLEDVVGRTFTEADTNLEVLPLRVVKNPNLPVDPAGDGRSRGVGPGSGGGVGGGHGPGRGRGKVPRVTGIVPDFKVVFARQTDLYYELKPGEYASTGAIIAVEVLIEMDGHVSHAHMVSGPEFVREAAEASALRWKFEPLAPHGFRNPTKLTIRYHCTRPTSRKTGIF